MHAISSSISSTARAVGNTRSPVSQERTGTSLHVGPLDVQVACQGDAVPAPLGYLLPPGAVAVRHPLGDARAFRHGWQSWSHSHWFTPGETPAYTLYPRSHLIEQEGVAGDPDLSTRSAGLSMVEAPEGQCLLLGSLGLGASVAMRAGALEGTQEGAPAPWYVACGPEREVLTQYTTLLAERLAADGRAARPEKRIASMWSSWYSHYDKITEPTLRRDLADLDGLGFEVFQVDDGWQGKVGDWDVNPARFPSGMAALAAEIRASGRRPGLWIAPFIASEHSRVFRAHPDWFVRDEQDRPKRIRQHWGGGYYGLDLTRPEARDHVRKVIATVKGWGFDVLKCDFLFAAAIEGKRHDSRLSREEVYREGARLIREEAGDDTYLLACGAPVHASIGIFDGIRTSMDTGPVWRIPAPRNVVSAWPSASEALKNSVLRLWLDPLIQLDPDVSYIGSSTPIISVDHKRASRALGTVCGLKETSDLVGRLTPLQREDLKAWVSRRDTVRCLDRYRYEVNGETVDFEPYFKESPYVPW